MAGKKRKNDDSPANLDSPKKSRRLMHCRSCDGAPLIKDCGCRKKPRTMGKKGKEGEKQLGATPATSGMSPHPNSNQLAN